MNETKSLTVLKNLLTIFYISIMLLTSCSKDDDNQGPNGNANYYIKAKVNDDSVMVSHLAQATQNGSDNNLVITLYAAASASNIYPFFNCDLDELEEISTGTYNSQTHQMLFEYYDKNNNVYGDYEINGTFPFQLKITEITPSFLKGTFQGALRIAGSDNEIVNISEGEFYLPRYYYEYGNTKP